MGKLILKAIIDKDPARAEITIQSFQAAWDSSAPAHDTKLKFVHFRDVDDFTAVASGNNRFASIVVAVGGLRAKSLAALKEFDSQSSITRILDENTVVDESPLFLCKTIRFPLQPSAITALLSTIRPVDAPPPPPANVGFHSPVPTPRKTLLGVNPLSPISISMAEFAEPALAGFKRKLPVEERRRSKRPVKGPQLENTSKEKEAMQGPKVWADIYAPGKLVLYYERSTGALKIKNADTTASTNLEINASGIKAGLNFSDFIGPGSSQCTVQRLLESVSCGVSTTFYLNMYSAQSKTALSAHLTTSVLCCHDDSFMTSPIVVVIFTMRSASVVGNAKLIGYGLHSDVAQSVKNCPLLRQNIVTAFGMQ